MPMRKHLNEAAHVEEPRSELAEQYAEFIRVHQGQLRQLLTMERQLNAAHATIARLTHSMEDLAASIANTLHYGR